MKVTYTTMFVGECPVDGTKDVYELEVVYEDNFLGVETILQAIENASRSPGYQEEITKDLRMRLVAAASIKTVGVHSGIRTTVTV